LSDFLRYFIAPGTAPVLTGNATNSSCVHITWSEPILSNGDIKKYKVRQFILLLNF